MECRIKFDLPLPNGKRLERQYRVEQYQSAKGDRSGVADEPASNCCHAGLTSKKFCGKCGAESPWKTVWRRVKVAAGSDDDAYKALEKRRFDEIEELLPEAKVFVVKEIRAVEAVSAAEERVAKMLYLGQGKSRSKTKGAETETEEMRAEYCEAVAVLRGYAAIGSMTLRSNNYEGVLDVVERGGVECLRLRLLVEQEQYNGVPEIEQKPVKETTVASLRKALGAVKSDEPYDFTQFRDVAVAQAEALVMKVVTGEPLPEIKQEAVAQKKSDEDAALADLVEGL